MRSRLFIPFPILFLLFFSCNTTAHLPVPGESGIKKRTISNEYLTIADTFYDLEKFDKAITYYTLAMKNKNIYWTCYYKLARSYAMSKNYTEARKMFLTLLKRDKENVNLRLSLAYLYAMEGKLSKAEVLYAYIWSENKENPDTLVNYIDVLIASEKYQKAGTYLNILKELFSDNSNIKTFEAKLKEMDPKHFAPSEEDKDNVLKEGEDKEEEEGKEEEIKASIGSESLGSGENNENLDSLLIEDAILESKTDYINNFRSSIKPPAPKVKKKKAPKPKKKT